MSDQTYLVILRLLHIGFGIFWAGSVFYFSFFLIPALKASGPEGVKFMQQLGKTGYPFAIMVSAIITIVAGFFLIQKLSGGFQAEWFHSSYARTLTTGAGMAFIAFIIGLTVSRPAAIKIEKVSNSIAAQGAPPTADQMAQLMAARKKIFSATRIISILLLVAIISMSIFRYM